MRPPCEDWVAVSDDYIAENIAQYLAGHFIYYPLNGRWYCADGPDNWRRDDTMLLTWRVRQQLRKFADAAGEAGIGERRGMLLSARKIKAVEWLLRSERELVADSEVWRPTPTGLARR